jgi:hypothetical protein
MSYFNYEDIQELGELNSEDLYVKLYEIRKAMISNQNNRGMIAIDKIMARLRKECDFDDEFLVSLGYL